MMRSFLAAATIAVMLCSGFGQARADDYKITVLSVPGANLTIPLGISSAGIVAITALTGGQSSSYTYDTRLKHPTLQPFNVPPQHGGTVDQTGIAGISLQGDLAGTYSETVGGVQGFYGYIYSGSSHTITKVEYPGATSTFVTAISSMGTAVAGSASVGSKSPAFVYRSATFRKIHSSTLDANRLQPKTVNNSGYVTGQYLDPTFQIRSFTAAGLAVDFNFTRLGVLCMIAGMNPPGNSLVGSCGTQAMITNGSAVTSYDVDGASQTALGAINVKDIAAGSAVTPQGTMIFSSDGGTITKSVLVPANWGSTGASGINAATKIVGAFLDTNDNILKAFWAH